MKKYKILMVLAVISVGSCINAMGARGFKNFTFGTYFSGRSYRPDLKWQSMRQSSTFNKQGSAAPKLTWRKMLFGGALCGTGYSLWQQRNKSQEREKELSWKDRFLNWWSLPKAHAKVDTSYQMIEEPEEIKVVRYEDENNEIYYEAQVHGGIKCSKNKKTGEFNCDRIYLWDSEIPFEMPFIKEGYPYYFRSLKSQWEKQNSEQQKK